MLSFERGKAIAKVVELEKDKDNHIIGIKRELNIIYLDDNKNVSEDDYMNMNLSDDLDPLAGFEKDFFRKDKNKKRYINPKQKQLLRKSLKANQEPEDMRLIGYYHEAKNRRYNMLKKEMYLDNPKLSIVPVPDHEKGKNNKVFPKRECLYISAPSGAGKSTYLALYALQFHKLFPMARMFIFSRVKSDPSIDRIIKIRRIMIDEKLVKKPIKSEQLKNSLVIFDDIDTIGDKDQKETVIQLRKDLLQTGRHETVYVISTSHQICDNKKTKTLITESRGVTVFPQSGNTYDIDYFLLKYGNIRKKEDVNKIIGLPSRWLTLYKDYPMYILHEQGVIILNNVKINKTKLKNDPNVFNYNDALNQSSSIENYLESDNESNNESDSEASSESE